MGEGIVILASVKFVYNNLVYDPSKNKSIGKIEENGIRGVGRETWKRGKRKKKREK